MNRPTVHRAIYLDEAERALQSDAWLEVDALLARFRQHDTSGCAVVEDEPRWTLIDKALAGLLIAIGVFAMWLAGWV